MTKSDDYRRRSNNIEKMMRKVGKSDREKLKEKKAALDALVNNEDWLEGKPIFSLKSK